MVCPGDLYLCPLYLPKDTRQLLCDDDDDDDARSLTEEIEERVEFSVDKVYEYVPASTIITIAAIIVLMRRLDDIEETVDLLILIFVIV
jgi:tetrahydromethanopterin S-methyltransferase subunit G